MIQTHLAPWFMSQNILIVEFQDFLYFSMQFTFFDDLFYWRGWELNNTTESDKVFLSDLWLPLKGYSDKKKLMTEVLLYFDINIAEKSKPYSIQEPRRVSLVKKRGEYKSRGTVTLTINFVFFLYAEILQSTFTHTWRIVLLIRICIFVQLFRLDIIFFINVSLKKPFT